MALQERQREVVHQETLYVVTCDGCGKEASEPQSSEFAARRAGDGWLHVGGLLTTDLPLFCSYRCVADYADEMHTKGQD